MQFDIRALKGAEGLVHIRIDAVDEASALAQARAQGLSVLSAQPRRQVGLPRLRSGFSLQLFSQELLALLSAGLSLVEVMDTMVEKEQKPEARKVLSGVRESLFEGRTFSHALQAFPAHFPTLFVATVQASERTGDLREALTRYIAYQERIDLVRKKMVSASIYPAVLIIAGGLVTMFLLTYIVPSFAGIYADSGRDLPWLSQLLIKWGQLLNDNGSVVLMVILMMLVLAGFGLRHAPAILSKISRRIPAIGERVRIYQLARFYRTLGMLLRGGTPLVTGLNMVAGLLPPQMRPQLEEATQRVREGISISAAAEIAGLSTPVAQRMLRVGEKSGDMAEMMERIAIFHDEELARWVDWFTKLFEPILMLVIGLIIGTIVVLMYLPIFELAGSLR